MIPKKIRPMEPQPKNMQLQPPVMGGRATFSGLYGKAVILLSVFQGFKVLRIESFAVFKRYICSAYICNLSNNASKSFKTPDS